MRGIGLRLLAAVTSLALARGAIAGQVFVTVNNPGGFFDTRSGNSTTTTLNAGDHVIWTWYGNGHTVTSGTDFFGDGKFDSGIHGPGTFFTWKTTGVGAFPYVCRPHNSFMQGTVDVGVPTAREADLRITEVRFDGVGSNFIEIANLGDSNADLVGFRLAVNGTATTLGGQVIGPQGRFPIANPAGLTNSGSVALYAPHTISNSIPSTNSLNDATMMIDYVEWGTAGGQALESIANQTTMPVLWTAGDFAPQAEAGHSIVFCGARGQYGRTLWGEATNPTPGALNDCLTPVKSASWGKIKTLYR